MTRLNRRNMLQLLASAPMAAGFAWTEAEATQAHHRAQTALAAQGSAALTPKFFTAHEYDTVRVLVDLIIPRDERSGSATDAGVPEFMDFIVFEREAIQTPMRGGLAWLDLECQKRFDKMFLDCDATERAAVLDDIAWPQRAKPEFSHGAEFFSSFRDLTGTGFWTSRMGIDDLKYIGNTYVPEWTGCPDECLQSLGVSDPPPKPPTKTRSRTKSRP